MIDIRMWIAEALVALLMGGCVWGCGLIEPETVVHYGPLSGFKLRNTKDVTVEIDNAAYDPDGHGFSVERLSMTDMSSPVITANIEQLRALNEQMLIHGQNIANGIGQLQGLMSAATGPLSVFGRNPVWGNQPVAPEGFEWQPPPGLAPSGWQLVPAPPPSAETQPAAPEPSDTVEADVETMPE